mmetsp:Transcript_22265/g.42273  ORF Transcript_22265/g.42273 Transcript_22265/m.42273 type:complete len:156 (-) Transcript_22265:139-606(-)|eukprot:scaffold1046_cov172-Amphora_coffeaeformis.AAC.13
MKSASVCLSLLAALPAASSFAFVAKKPMTSDAAPVVAKASYPRSTSTSLRMVDDVVLQGAGIAVAGLVAGIGLVAFTEQQGERAKERGGGLSDSMSTRIAGKLMEDVEVSSISDIDSLTSQLEKALKETGGAKDEQFETTEADKKRMMEEADDGW